ncbi:MAG: phospho-N-acetylmuramoyl-pentapeptide-transferase [Bacteroidetes bacterium 4572_112]|nr:MAG: phospho-N-acetylmuramoyl-pentapeptide-transferase [Bacteroidetes bacterium 4572_112]
MLYHLFELLQNYDIPGLGLFQYITFRAAGAAITALLISFVFGPKIIKIMKVKQIGELAKNELQNVGNHSTKAGTPTMGGFIVLASIIIPALLWAPLNNIFIQLILFTTVFLGLVGFIDDYLKVIKKKQKGLIGKYKLVGQILVGLVVACVIYFFPNLFYDGFEEVKSLTQVPFVKNISIDFGLLYIPLVIFVMAATSNAVNLTDGLDGLSIGTVGIATLAISVIAYVTGNANFAEYLNIIYMPGAGELTVFTAAMLGAALGFLWYNSHPAQIFMGDTGSLALGGAIGCLMILLKKELLLPIVGGVFFAETLSVILQVLYFKYTRKKYGEGRRIFKMSPIHHHFEKSGWHESKIVIRFYIMAIMLAIISMASFKIR